MSKGCHFKESFVQGDICPRCEFQILMARKFNLSKLLSGKSFIGQPSPWATVTWTNVSINVILTNIHCCRVLGTWMTKNCRKSCNKCKCNCCSYKVSQSQSQYQSQSPILFKGKSHKLGEKILLPDKCGELVCEESLVAPPSPLLDGAVQHNVSHPEEVTLVFRSLHTGADCCVLDNGTMVAEGEDYIIAKLSPSPSIAWLSQL